MNEVTIDELIDTISSKADCADIVKILIENEDTEELAEYVDYSDIQLSNYLDDETKDIIIDEVVDREIVVQYLGGMNLEKALYEAIYYNKVEALNMIRHYDINILKNIIEKYNS